MRLTPAADGSTVRGLVVNRAPTTAIASRARTGFVLEGCFIGTDPAGTAALGNAYGGILVKPGPDERDGSAARRRPHGISSRATVSRRGITTGGLQGSRGHSSHARPGQPRRHGRDGRTRSPAQARGSRHRRAHPTTSIGGTTAAGPETSSPATSSRHPLSRHRCEAMSPGQLQRHRPGRRTPVRNGHLYRNTGGGNRVLVGGTAPARGTSLRRQRIKRHRHLPGHGAVVSRQPRRNGRTGTVRARQRRTEASSSGPNATSATSAESGRARATSSRTTSAGRVSRSTASTAARRRQHDPRELGSTPTAASESISGGDLFGVGATTNDDGDADSGPNSHQNYPIVDLGGDRRRRREPRSPAR